MNTTECRRIIWDLRQTVQTVERGNIDQDFAIELCISIMSRSANELQKLVKELEDLEDDRK